MQVLDTPMNDHDATLRIRRARYITIGLFAFASLLLVASLYGLFTNGM
jgi:hypothetical protein